MQSGPEQLADWMERRGFTHAETAEYIGLHQPEVSMYLNRKRTPGLNTAILIERRTGIPVEAWMLASAHSSPERSPRDGETLPK